MASLPASGSAQLQVPAIPALPAIAAVIAEKPLKRSTRKLVNKFNKKNEFPLFKKLPSEIRTTIWKMSLPGGRLITIMEHEEETAASYAKVHAKYAIPPQLHTCFEARMAALSVYDEAFGYALGGNPLYIDFSRDGLLIDGFAAIRAVCQFSENSFCWEFRKDHPSSQKPVLLALTTPSSPDMMIKNILNFFSMPEHVILARYAGPARWVHRHVEKNFNSYLAQNPLPNGENYKPSIECRTFKGLRAFFKENGK